MRVPFPRSPVAKVAVAVSTLPEPHTLPFRFYDLAVEEYVRIAVAGLAFVDTAPVVVCHTDMV